MTDQIEPMPDGSIVIEYDGIPGEKETEFRKWQSEIRSGVTQFEGYLRTDVFPAIKDAQDKWYIIVHFDTPANLSQWLDSDTRHRLISMGKRRFGAYRYHMGNGLTGLEAWFSKRIDTNGKRSHPPAWKQNFAVLFGLYPTVMVETLLFAKLRFMDAWALPYQMFVSNLVSCSLLTWVVMPSVTWLLSFWLKPQQMDGRLNLIGALLVFLGYSLMVAVFRSLV
ncbi:antibiotic biosynthesis monooxygenase [Stenomitos frigidus]|uniref:ABM domain-containing protein n=1 Tax=Stenomitos frigidus ULC18 TaxID=2107698 RepID=A0A2T1DVP3_9CYAN|nr:antibiotic biosynthesis monooxygenase [Stenomitos frigidus]PSB24586.1 hypothetical protein C7B82_26555 [Stenomitos frigidus ULC18]